jgi:hypothetical protein
MALKTVPNLFYFHFDPPDSRFLKFYLLPVYQNPMESNETSQAWNDGNELVYA